MRRPRPLDTRTRLVPVGLSLPVLALACGLLVSTPPAAGAATAAGLPAHGTSPAAHSSADAWGDKNWGDLFTDLNAENSKGVNDPSKDAGSLATITKTIGARSVWATQDSSGRAVTGQGVTVALLDTGINSTVTGLNGTGKVIAGPDLSLEANSPNLVGGDNFGHGTHLAGIIAAKDPVAVDKNGAPKPADDSVQLGVAPDARLLAVKLGTRDGSVDVSQVIAGIDWVVQHRNDNGMNVRVINLSYGTEQTQDYSVDPLAAAAENAWNHGIVVVASGGNDGASAGRLTDPAIDPFVIAVGATDPQGLVKGWKSPTVASFTSRGTAARHVDLDAPGTSVSSLRDPGSYVDVTYPSGLVAGDSTGRLFRGSGTSQAAAVVSGAAALLLQAYPALTPDEVKWALDSSADTMVGNSLDTGAGEVNVASALSLVARTSWLRQSSLTAGLAASRTAQQATPSTGLGSLDAARGDSRLVDPDTGVALTGEVDVQGQQ